MFVTKARGEMGSITVFVGPMFAGKTTRLITTAGGYDPEARLVVRPAVDTRYPGAEIVSHPGLRLAAIPVRDLMAVTNVPLISKNTQHVFIDEGQFFPDLVEACEAMRDAGLLVHVAALSGTWMRRAFPVVADLMATADRVLWMQAACACGRPAPFTRIAQRPDTGGDKETRIGGAELYRPCCALHYREEVGM